METTYYIYSNPYRGERYFKVTKYEKVLQIIASVIPKKGRPYQEGVNYIAYSTFIGSYGWKMKESRWLKEISKARFDKLLDKMIVKFKK